MPATAYFTPSWQSGTGRVDQNFSVRALPARTRGVPDTIEITVDISAKESGEDCNGETSPAK